MWILKEINDKLRLKNTRVEHRWTKTKNHWERYLNDKLWKEYSLQQHTVKELLKELDILPSAFILSWMYKCV